MKFSAKLSLLAAALVLANPSFSDPVCPDLKEIQLGGFSIAFGTTNHYFAYKLSKYNTDTNWGFVMGPFAVPTREAALEAAYSALSNMNSAPIYYHECIYSTGISDLYAIAVQDPVVIPEKLEQSITTLVK
ncbi:DUF4949 domain-containing protein [Legionella saoudiensis]|uniref:DUF4949 domain-containing protein n=1 Tax=Legionella saoudiensis TaxID=1750561 RepID=UPI00072FD49F|nr:DUF4949 domain-containing protein [Legionella saoudiensis]